MEKEELQKRMYEIKIQLHELRYKESEGIKSVIQENFDKANKEFEETEKRGSLYPLFTKLMRRGDRLTAYLFILSTWNFAGFRYLIGNFDINKFNENIDELEQLFNEFGEKHLRTIKFEEYKEKIIKIYDTLSKQVKSVGATKIMHLRVPEVFVLWDRRIREYYGFRSDSAENYIEFLKKMQEKFKDIKLEKNDRSFAKAIDEYNYTRITQPMMNLEKELTTLKKRIDKLKI
ncbi:MAG: hypothetical protein Q7S06_01895 [Nanoarchaeota archaeon]|nr:hypothetical protein [Nanoarchaeota archaeon]